MQKPPWEQFVRWEIWWDGSNLPVPRCQQLLNLCLVPCLHKLDDRVIHIFVLEPGVAAELTLTAQPMANLDIVSVITAVGYINVTLPLWPRTQLIQW